MASFDWSFSKLAAKVQAASTAAADTVTSVKRSIEAELGAEYEKTAAPEGAGRPAAGGGGAGPPPAQRESALERMKAVSVALLNPLDDAAPAKPSAPERVVMLPWERPGLSEATRTRMRALSQERSIFLAPPAGGNASFRFDLQASLSLILEALSVDKWLEDQRRLLVPQQVSEEQFFTNYFHHLQVLASMSSEVGEAGASDSLSGADGRAPGGGAGRQSPPSSASPVLVSAAASDASDLAATRDLVAECGGEGRSVSVVPADGGVDSADLGVATPATQRTLAAAASADAPEEQFECVSAHLLESARRSAKCTASALASHAPGARVSAVAGSASTDASAAVPAAASASAPGTRAALPTAEALTLSWEEELKAELA